MKDVYNPVGKFKHYFTFEIRLKKPIKKYTIAPSTIKTVDTTKVAVFEIPCLVFPPDRIPIM